MSIRGRLGVITSTQVAANPTVLMPDTHVPWAGCNCNASVVCLCFDLQDADHNGKIGADEFDFMIVDVFGPEWEKNDEAKAVHAW